MKDLDSDSALICLYKYDYYESYLTFIFIKLGLAELLPGSGVEGATGSENNNSPPKKPKYKFETIITMTLSEMNKNAITNLDKLFQKFNDSENTENTKKTNLTTNINDVLSAIHNIENRKCKLEGEITVSNNNNDINKKR